MRTPSISVSKIRIIVSGLVLIFLADFLFFRIGLWILPNESSWGSNYFYNFIYEFRSLDSKPKKGFRILLLGSSIAHYSLDRRLLEEEILRKSGKQVEVEFLTYAGMAPLDAYLLKDKILSLRPDLIVYPVNFIDWRLHRAYVLEPKTGKNETISEDRLLLDALDFQDAPQSKYIFPWETFSEFWNIIGPEKAAEYSAAGLFSFYRYKDIYWKQIRTFYEHRFGRNTSYQEYNGVQIPERVTSRGWTGKSFSFAPREYMVRSGFYIQVVEEILRPGPLRLEMSDSLGRIQVLYFDSPGWKNVKLRPEFLNKGENNPIRAELSATWVPYGASGENKDWSRDLLGVRLQQTFGSEIPRRNRFLIREERTEDLRYEGMSKKEYEEYFNFRLLSEPGKRPGIQYLRVLADSKRRIAEEKFRPVLHFRYMKEFLTFMNGNRVPVLLVNNPENPISLSWYQESDWYREHLRYLREISIREECFLDLKDFLPPNDFWDYHHFTYQAMKKMNSTYVNAILKFVE